MFEVNFNKGNEENMAGVSIQFIGGDPLFVPESTVIGEPSNPKKTIDEAMDLIISQANLIKSR